MIELKRQVFKRFAVFGMSIRVDIPAELRRVCIVFCCSADRAADGIPTRKNP